MLFPLKQEDVAKELTKYRKFDDESKISQEIRLTKPAFIEDNVPVTPSSEAKWFELSPAGSSFVRTIPLEGFPELYKKYPTAHRLLVWEFEDEDGRNPAGILVQPAPPAKGEYFVIDEEVKGWSGQIEKKVKEKAEK
jgi:hypothetical protein